VCAAFYGFGDLTVAPAQAAANLTMVPQAFGLDFVDGVYWTLQYEVAFYALIFSLLLVGNDRLIDRFLQLWPWLMAAALLLGVNKLPFLGGFFTYFAAGAVLARWDQWPRARAIPTLILAIALSVIWGVTKAQSLSVIRGVEYPPVVVASLILLMFAFFLSLRSDRIASQKFPGAAVAGGITYPLYLIHAHFGYMMLASYGNDANKAWLIPVVMIAAITIACVIYLSVDRGMRAFWHRSFKALVGDPVDRVRSATVRRILPTRFNAIWFLGGAKGRR
jgi:peptidoglycan/LPS O-acetylase OafA/YrhL